MRFAIQGFRPGESLFVSGAGRFRTSDIDGGLTLTDEQRAKLEAAGHTLIVLGEQPAQKEPTADEQQARANAEQTIAANKEAAQKVAGETQAVRKPKARKA